MNLKQRPKPRPLQKLDAAIPRLSPTFPNLGRMQEDARKHQQGYSGEKKIDYFLDNLAPIHTILHDVYLRENNKNFQMDSLAIANHSISLIDSKNYNGTITFNTTLRQLTRSDGKVESGFGYPITQVNNQNFHLQNWLNQHNLGHIPIKSFVAIADPSTVVKVEGSQEEISNYVVHAAELPVRILNADRQFGKKGARKLSDYQIGKTILSKCSEFDIDLFKKYGVRPADILPGVICPDCGWRGMERVYNGWHCRKCHCFSRHAHLKALDDYFLLVKDSITNKACMWFLGSINRGTATRILKTSGLVYNNEHRCWQKA
ncbi:nuclease-related domain-containing protein [Lentibacillus sp. CBA3610]|uniref:nuclease-related domain-containing protein n=1 Tax=Lentibacillus sp. CBA3610 TaxID=2518176 RepID=UPI00159617E1|nr:nuclease-related domain-containing protein [Lentibacillus sp. CBA3610]QKY70328.1 NERD domain-containing protein [Lentibacillus sp. CBA3610]